jgi:RNA polymerase sigma-70 factor (ECF subfamily)
MKAPSHRLSGERTVTDWDRLVREHGPAVFGTAWRILGHAADTEDVVQEVFLEAYRLRAAEPVRCWPALLRRLAACRALDRLRQRRTVLSLNGLSVAGPNGDPEAAAIGKELADRLRQAVADLPEREATVFCLRYFEDLSNQRIAEILSIQPGAVGVALHKARAKLEALLTEAPTGDGT